jgi:hypothetical protein
MKQTTLLTWSLLVLLGAAFATARAGTAIPSAISRRTVPDGRSEYVTRKAVLRSGIDYGSHIENFKNHIPNADEALFFSHYIGIIAGCVWLQGL